MEPGLYGGAAALLHGSGAAASAISATVTGSDTLKVPANYLKLACSIQLKEIVLYPIERRSGTVLSP